MTTNQPRNHRMTRLAYLGLGALTLLAVAATASALPIGLSHKVDTPAGYVAAGYEDDAANVCISPGTPALPALPAVPAVPLPLPIGVPALPSAPALSGAATVCADASADGVYASATADAAGQHAETSADVDTSQQHEAAKGAASGVKGFFSDLAGKIGSWF